MRPSEERIQEMGRLHDQWMKENPHLAWSLDPLTWDEIAQHIGVPPEEFRYYWDETLKANPR